MIPALRTFRVRPVLPEPLEALSELAYNLHWAWDQDTQELFRWIDPDGWEAAEGNPVELLGRVPVERLEALAADGAFLAQLGELHAGLERYVTQPRWAQAQDPPPPRVAYFSPEFALTHSMQTYSGGLGVLAGDHLKAASDLGLEMVGVGLLYRHGYFRQHLDADGWQQEHYPDLNPHNLPLVRLERDGAPVTVEVQLAGNPVICQIWKAQVGRVPLLLLDTDLPGNAPSDRVVTDKLYGGDVEHRLRQEIVLGIGGVRALDLALQLGEVHSGPGWEPDVYHSNEGHAGFLQLERIRKLTAQGLSFDEAIESARAAVLFTTHTPVPAGIDVFPRELMAAYFTDFAKESGVDLDRLMDVGQITPGEGTFNMAVMGLRLSAAANGVSRLHGRVSRAMFTGLWPQLPESETPITSVTNGVHALTWVGREMAAVFDRHLAPGWPDDPDAWARASEIGDDVLWRARARARERMVQAVRRAVRKQRERRGEPSGSLLWADAILDPEALTIGFARRFAEYKRGTLLLRQPERLAELLLSADRPVQLIFAGKAHPRDDLGKDLIRQIVHYSSDPDLRTRVVFVEDYDMEIAATLYQGCDLWLNNPRRPHEACGTSGEKSVLNGGLHCSTMDGWWDELYDGENGFAIGSATDYTDTAQHDAADAQSLFDLLEDTIVPMFYDRAEGPLPRRWLARVRRSLHTLGPRVLASRMVEEYATQLYAPVAERARRLGTDDHRRARELASWREQVASVWDQVALESVSGEDGVAAIGEERDIEVLVRLGALEPTDVRVELLHGAVSADGTLDDPNVEVLERSAERDGLQVYNGSLLCAVSGEYGMALRVVPFNPDLLSWTDTGLVTWATG
jgi:glycogen phosphorylase